MAPAPRSPGLLWRTLGLLPFPILATSPTIGLAYGSLDGAGIAVVIAILVFCLGVHEAAHAQVALWCGDSTASDLGRITVDPRSHIDLFQTILLPLFLYLSAGFIFGGAKPVPVNPMRLRKPLRDMSLVAIAGPLSNFLLAILFALILGVLLHYQVYTRDQMMVAILTVAVQLNLLLAAFNLMPVPPLDGSRVMTWLLPAHLRRAYMELERFGLLIVFGLVLFVPGFQGLIRWTMNTLMDVVLWIIEPMLALLP